MRHRLGCAAFTIVGLLWLGYTSFHLLVDGLGNCAGDAMCESYRRTSSGLIVWRGIAVALFLILAYLGFRALNRDDDV
ncbi:MAG TPA: hypothetical protein VEZ20_06545 [Allosphingosinicella sp.]|nr:hypothetical protein [Allosphingosinicella sp.]